MKDINFDELDQAVSSALANDSKPTEPASETAISVNVKRPPAVVERIAPTPAARPTPASTSSTPRRSGRFMDMVHNSSDMKPPQPVHSGKKLAPISANVTPDLVTDPIPPTASSEEIAEAPRATLDTIHTDPAETDDTSIDAISSWPDPLDMMKETDTATTKEPVDSETSQPDPDPTPTQSEPEQTVETPQTPFLADTKVDKRPLGGFPDETAEASLSPEKATSNEDSINLPRELESDVVAVEADEPSEVSSANEPVHETSLSYSAPVVTSDPASASSSIPQQYHTETSEPDDNTHSVFDTSAYHQPLIAAKTKRSHTWMWVVIILSLLAVGSVLGALSFMAGL